MKKIYISLLLMITVLFSIIIVVMNGRVLQLNYVNEINYYTNDEIRLENLEKKQINYDFLLNYKNIVVVGVYNDGNRGIYDPKNVMNKDTLPSAESRYFNEQDYVQKTPYYIAYDYHNGNNIEKTDLEIAHYRYKNLSGPDEKDYLMYNIFYRQEAVNHLVLDGADASVVSNELQKLGLALRGKTYYSVPMLLSLTGAYRITGKVIMVSVLLLIVTSLIAIWFHFNYRKKELSVDIASGLTYRRFLKQNLLPIIVQMIVTISLLTSVTILLSQFHRIHILSIIELGVYAAILYCVSYVLFGTLLYKKVEKTILSKSTN